MRFIFQKKLVVLALLVGPSAFAAPQDEGLWSEGAEVSWPINVRNTLITPQGNVLTIGSTISDSANKQLAIDVWNPNLGMGDEAHNTIIADTIPVTDYTMFFFSSMLLAGTNKVFLSGGVDLSTYIDNVGSYLFDTETNELSRAADSASTTQQLERTLSNFTVLPNGEVMYSGLPGYGNESTIYPEIYSPTTDQWRTLTGVPEINGTWVLPSGEVYVFDEFSRGGFLDYTGSGSITSDESARIDDINLRSSSVMSWLVRGNPVMYRPGKFYEAGVSFTGLGPSVVDINGRDISIRETSAQRVPDRKPIRTILLPTGDAMSVTNTDLSIYGVDPRLEIWDANTENWTLMADGESETYPIITLLKDGRILARSGREAKIFSPPYLFNNSGELADRPEIVSAPSQGAYNSQISVGYNSDKNISRVTLVSQSRPGRVGFSSPIGERFMELDFNDTEDGVNVILPESASLAPPGYYIMYLIDDQGVPSEGHMISLNPSNQDTSVYPSANDDVVTVTIDEAITINVLLNDQGSSLTLNPPNEWSLKGGNVALVDNKLRYTPKAGFTGEDNIWYTFVDALGRTNSGKVTMIVRSDSYPAASEDNVTTSSGDTITIDVLANDTGEGLILYPPNRWSLKGGTVVLVDNKLNYTPKEGFTGEDNIWYRFSDSHARYNSGKVTITVNATSADSPYPTASEDNVETTTSNATTIDVLANDNGNGLVLHAPNAWSLKGGTVELVDNQLVYTSKAGFVGDDNIWYVFEDSQGRINSGQVNITVSSGGTTPFPVANADSYTTSKGIGKNLDILSNDTASGGIAIDTLYEYTANGGTTYKTPEGLVWYTPKAGFTGEDNFWYVMVDSEGRKNSAKVVINVNP